MARTPAARLGSRRPDRQPDRLDARVHAHPVRRMGSVLRLRLVRFRRSRNPVADYTAVKSHASSYLEVGVAVVEMVLLFAFSIPLWAAGSTAFRRRARRWSSRSRASSSPGTSTIPAPTGIRPHRHQAGRPADNPLGLDRTDPAAKDDITTLNQLYLPVNKPVIVHLSSKDVIHSFGLPELRVKQDAIPGLTIPIWFIPNVTTARVSEQYQRQLNAHRGIVVATVTSAAPLTDGRDRRDPHAGRGDGRIDGRPPHRGRPGAAGRADRPDRRPAPRCLHPRPPRAAPRPAQHGDRPR